MNKVREVTGLEEIYKSYDTFILDQWGVMHDGETGYLKAKSCINKLYDINKKLIIISNSSKRKKLTLKSLKEMGFNASHFLEIMTSGEMIWQSLLYEQHTITKKLGKNCFHIFDKSKEDSIKFIEGLEKFNFVENIEEADFILGCTPYFNSKIVDFIPLLYSAHKKNLPFICANPDFETVNNSSEKFNFCIGTIAELYQNLGGKVFILGKPSFEIYYESIKKISNLDKKRILAIGDSLYHDIEGAINFGIDSLLITSTGIHQLFFDKQNPSWNDNSNTLKKLGIEPTFLCSDFNF